MRTLALLLACLLVSAAAPPQEPLTVIIVRHAERAPEPADDPVLTSAGRARAEVLAAALAHADVRAIFVTEYARTQLTAAPLARRIGSAPRVRPVRGRPLDEEVRALAELIRREHAGSTVLVVGHSNTVPAIAAALGAPRLPDLDESEYDTMLVLHITQTATRLVRARYGAGEPAR